MKLSSSRMLPKKITNSSPKSTKRTESSTTKSKRWSTRFRLSLRSTTKRRAPCRKFLTGSNKSQKHPHQANNLLKHDLWPLSSQNHHINTVSPIPATNESLLDLGLIQKKLCIDPFGHLHPWDGLAYLHRRHVDVKLRLVHQIADSECCRNCLSIFAVEKDVAFGSMAVYLCIDFVEIDIDVTVVMER